MDEELKKALAAIAELKAKLDSGMISKDYFDQENGKLKAEVASLNAKIKEMDEMWRKRATAMDGAEKDKDGFSMGKALCGIFLGKWAGKADANGNVSFVKAEDSVEYNKLKEYNEAINKDVHSTTGGAGGYAIAPQYIQTWIEKLYANLVLVKAGVRTMTGLKGSPVYVPRHSGSTTAVWIGEGDAITESKITDQQISMTPKECAALVTINNKLLMLAASTPSIEQLIMNDMEMQLRLAIDLAGLRGTGSNNQPRGVANTSNILSHALGDNGDYFDFDDVLDMEGKLEDSNALQGKLAFITHGKIKRRLKKTKIAQFSGDTGGQYVLFPMSEANIRDSIGYDMHTTSQIPTNLTKASGTNLSEIYFANWDDLILGQWGGLDIAASNSAGTAFEQNQTKIRMIQSVDFAVRHPESFVLCNDAKTV